MAFSVFLLDKTASSLYNSRLTAPGALEMSINISDIPPEGLTLELAQKLDLFDTGTASTAFTAVLSIKPAGNGNLTIDGTVHSTVQLECSRCLKKFAYDFKTELAVQAAPMSAMEAEPEHELAGAELDMEFYQGDEIEPLQFVKEQILISIPMVPLHSPDCKGLCPECGTDLNVSQCECSSKNKDEFGPFSVLKDLFKK